VFIAINFLTSARDPPTHVTFKYPGSRRSTRPRSTPATPKTPKGTPSKNRKIISTTEEEGAEKSRKSTRVRTPNKRLSEDDFKVEKYASKNPTPKPAKITPIRIKKGKIVSSPKEEAAERSRRSTRVQNYYKNPSTPDTSEDEKDDDFQVEKYTSKKRAVNTPRSVKSLVFSRDTTSNNSSGVVISKCPGTPKRRRSSIEAVAHRDTPAGRRRTMTPRIAARTVPIGKDKSALEEAQRRLHVGAVPDSLPCRDNEFREIEISQRPTFVAELGAACTLVEFQELGKQQL